MIQTGIESRVKVQDIIENQLPEFILDESPKSIDFLKQYYISQEYQGGPIDISDNIDQYLKLDNLTPQVIVDSTSLTSTISSTDSVVNVTSTKGFPSKYGLLKIDNEVITYTGLTTNTFTGCVRGFSGITSYHDDLNSEELVFSKTTAAEHSIGSNTQNLSALFLKEFYKKTKFTFAPGFEEREFSPNLNAGNFIKEIRSFYNSKGTDESFRILFNVLYNETPSVINLEENLIKPSSAEFIRREIVVAEFISDGNPANLLGQTIFKTSDPETQASISEIEPFTRAGIGTFYKIGLFVGYSDQSAIEGTFKITPSTKCLERTDPNSSVISVDSTIGFSQTGTIISGNNVITYTDKSINQFLNCSGITDTILPTDNVYLSSETYFGYENGDTSKKIDLRLTGVLSDFNQISESISVSEGQLLSIKTIGNDIKNYASGEKKTYEEIFANSWIYNASPSIEIESFGGSIISLKTGVDRTQLKKGDKIEIIDIGTRQVVYPTLSDNQPFIEEEILFDSKTIKVSNFGFSSSSPELFAIRRKINKSSSQFVEFKYGNESIISDIQNVHTDDNYAYVSSNSLPSSGIGYTDFSYTIQKTLNESVFNPSQGIGALNNFVVTIGTLQEDSAGFDTISFDVPVSFITGDRIYYQSTEGNDLIGLTSGETYYVEVLSDPKNIKLYNTPSSLETFSNAVKINLPQIQTDAHIFTINSQSKRIIDPQKVLKKFALPASLSNGDQVETLTGSTGMLINGVEIFNYKTEDKIYYGPIQEVSVLNGGNDFDVINPPKIEISAGAGTTALVQPAVSGTITEMYVDTQEFNVGEIVSVNVTGGNIKGGSFKPIITKRRKSIPFDARSTTNGGGISTTTSQLSFLKDHYLVDGEEVFYNNNQNPSVSIGIGLSSLSDENSYFVKVDNNTTIQLFESYNDYLSGNPIGFGTTSLSGTQEFLVGSLGDTVSGIEIIDGGSLTNRKLLVKPTGISTVENSVIFTNHGFSSGEIIEYNYYNSSIAGLSTNNQYYVLSDSKDSFRLCDAGIDGSIRVNFEQEKTVKFLSTGVGLQEFKYPDIVSNVKFYPIGIGSTTQVRTINVTPVVKGEISQLYLYENGTGYGSTILNNETKPIFTLKNGRECQIEPIIINGRIENFNLQFGGFEYFSTPNLEVVDPTGSGSGAILRAQISDGKVEDVKIINPGIGYSTSTKVNVVSTGNNEVFDISIRSLNVNNVEKIPQKQYEIFNNTNDYGIQYFVSGYDDNLRSVFGDNGLSVSKIIGWAYDGNPIYGSFGYSDPTDTNSGIKTLTSGYSADISNIFDRPSGFSLGFFIEDYRYTGNGDLDKSNGRFSKTPDFPEGIYAYHAIIDDFTGIPVFPYFIGNTYRSEVLPENTNLDQSFDFNNSSLIRNTHPYKIYQQFANNDFVIESNKSKEQLVRIDSVTKGEISEFNIINPGDNYKVNDNLKFDNTDTEGGGILASVVSIKGKTLSQIDTNIDLFNNSVFVWNGDKVKVNVSPFHTLSNFDNVIISGFATSLSKLNNNFKVSVKSNPVIGLSTEITISDTEIYLTNIPSIVSAGSSIGIGTEIMSVLNVFSNKNILRVQRGLTGTAHSISEPVLVKNNSFDIDLKLDYFKSSVNEKVYFNPKESVGLGTTSGIGYSTSFTLGNETITRDIPTQRIYLEDHPFQNNQRIVFNSNGSPSLSISTNSISPFSIPSTLYTINKSPNTIGIKTGIGTEFTEVFFHSNGNNSDTYLFETTFDQELGDVSKIQSTLSVSTAHGLSTGDLINLKVKPNLSVGIGTSTAVRVIYNSDIDNILINPIGFNSIGVNTTFNKITITNHQLKTGDKVLYEDNNFEYLIDSNDQIDTTAQDGSPEAIFFKPDGTKMYIIGRSADEVNEYELSTPWSPSTATFANLIDITTEDTNPSGIYIRDDGLKFWVCGYQNDRIYQYSMSTAWDISTASYDNVNLFVGSGNSLGFVQNTPEGIYFKYDGTVLYIIGRSQDFIHQVDLSTPWDLNTASYSGNSTGRLDINPPESNPMDMAINSSGTLLYWVGTSVDQLFIYRLSTPWDITSGVEIDRFAYTNPTGLYVSPDEDNFYLVNTADDIVGRFVRPSPLTGNEYYINKIDDDNVNLCDTFKNSNAKTPVVVSFASTGSSSQNISPINPRIKSVKNNNLVFDLSDSSLSGYQFKVYYDREFKNEFVSTGSTDTFNISGVGTVGVTSTSSFTITYTENIPEILYYTLEKSGYISSSDKIVNNYSEILYIDSEYNGSYEISNVGLTTFQICLTGDPENSSYSNSECDIFEYTTKSTSADGPVDKINLISGGSGYKKLPKLIDTDSVNGKNLFVEASSKNIGNVREIKIINQGFEYSSDRTLEPQAFISPKITLKDSNTIGIITVTDGGKNFISTPEMVVINKNSREIVDNGLLTPVLVGNSISDVIIDASPKGVSDQSAELFTINNSNGISIIEVQSNSSGIFTCFITTPNGGFSVPPFTVGDEVFIEGVQQFSSDGSGFNSSDYGYKFFTVTNFDTSTINDSVTISVTGLTTNTGIAKTVQDSSGTIVNKNVYPTFEITLKDSFFESGERLKINDIDVDLKVSDHSNTSPLIVEGTYELSKGEKITGELSGNVAKIQQIEEFYGNFKVEYSSKQDEGWTNEIGKLSEDYQVLPDNDYYQNMSYSIKSTQQWNDIRTSVNSLVHSSGLKNFSDTQVMSESKSGIITSTDVSISIKDIIEEKRVDTINNFDFVKDHDIVNQKSRFIKLNKIKLTNYTEIGSNISLRIDDISKQFSNFDGEPNEFKDILNINTSNTYSNYLFKVVDTNNTEIQLTNLIIINDKFTDDSFILEKQSLVNVGSGLTVYDDEQYGDFTIATDTFGSKYIRFEPKDPFDTEYDIKYIEKTFVGTGVGSTSIGSIDIVSSNNSISAGSTSLIVNFAKSNVTSFFVSANVIQNSTNELNFVELYVTHDGTNTNITEYYFNNESTNVSFDKIGIGFTASINGSSVELEYNNDTLFDVSINSRIVSFGTPVSDGTFRFLSEGQPAGSERSAIYKSSHVTTTGISTTVLSLDKNLFDSANCLVEVSMGSTRSTHQLFLVQDVVDIYTQEYSILSIGSTSGIGTFGGEYSGANNFNLMFYPDASMVGTISISSLNECLYSSVDFENDYNDLKFGVSNESVRSSAYFAINGDRVNRLNFVLKSNKIPIFAKKFNPSNSNILNTSTGTFNIPNNFFSNGEELIYSANSTFSGVDAVPVTYTNGSITAELPSQVFAVVSTANTSSFQISTTRNGSPITFTATGEGNAHQLEMFKKNEKAIITIDNIAQYPIAFTKISQSLSGNGGGITTTSTIFSLSGISTINPLDILRIDDEYMNIINVGLGTQNIGPITNTGSETLVQVERGFVGSSATSHSDGTSTRIYKGSYNIVGDQIFFTKPPRGKTDIVRDNNNLVLQTSDFTGRVFFRKNYDTSQVYDDISDEFTGIGRTFTLTVGGANTTGIGSTGGNGIVFINGIFQTPTTDNNPENNFQIFDNSVAGISSISFSGIRTDAAESDSALIVDSDVNQNQLPRGGIIVSLGSSGGLGYAPPVGAAVSAVVSSGSIIGINTGLPGGTFGSGYNGIVSIGVSVFESGHTGSVASITATPGSGGALSFTINSGGSGYNNPEIHVSEPSYSNLDITGISRIGVGATTQTGIGLSISIDVGASSTTGIGSTYFQVNNFSISKNGYGFRKGDVFTPVGLVTDGRLTSPISNFELTVLSVFNDNFGAWQFGELDFIDSLKNFQDGERLDFPLFYNESLLSFELPEDSSDIELQNSLVIFINGVLQDPGSAYQFNGGTSFVFTTAPKPEDDIAVFFYRGTKGEDDIVVTNVIPTLERGDDVRVFKNNDIPETLTQNQRTVTDLSFSDKFETNLYSDQGIDIKNLKPMSWTKQKVDRVVNGENVSKSRQSIISQIYPTAKVIDSITTSDTEIFVDNSDLFDYDTNESFNMILVDNKELSTGNITASISGGEVNSLTIANEGSGYTPGATIDIKFESPETIGAGIGTTATATASISSTGIIQSTSLTNPGLGYTTAPLAIVPSPEINKENVTVSASGVKGFSGIITQISVASSSTVGFAVSVYDDGGGNKYYINDVKQDTLTLTKGVTYTFTLAGSVSGHPFHFQTTDNGGAYDSANVYTDGVTNAGADSGTITFTVPSDAPNTLYYRCQFHSGMGASINVSGLSLEFHLKTSGTFNSGTNVLASGYPVFIKNTNVGSGVTSIDGGDSSIIGIGTMFLDNIYYANQVSSSGGITGIITCNVNSSTNVSSLPVSGDIVGEFSWGRFAISQRSSSPISIAVTGKTLDVGLSTFPTVQRRSQGLRQIGSINESI